MPNFSQEQLDLIASQKKPNDQLPTYFYVALNAQEVISRDFEAYLILQTQQQKQSTLQWIRQALDFQEDRLDRDAILTRYLVLRNTDDVARLEEINTRLSNFDAFRAGLLQGSSTATTNIDWSAVIEIDLLAQSLQQPLDEIVLLYDLTFHEQNVVSVLQNRLTNTAYGQAEKKELQSWQTVISAYEGQSSGTPSPSTPIGGPSI